MKHEDKTIDKIPDLSISADEPSGRKASTGKAHKSKAAPESKKSDSSIGIWLVLILVILLAGGGFWQFRMLQNTLATTQSELVEAREQLQQVNGAVNATGENLNKSGSVLRSELNEASSEIRKLWDVSNKRNKAWILNNRENLLKVTQLSESTSENLEKLKKAMNVMQSQTEKAEQLVRASNAEQLALKSEMTNTLTALTKKQQALEDKLATQQKMTQSMDAYRQQVNQKIQQIETTVRNLSKPKEQGLSIEGAPQ